MLHVKLTVWYTVSFTCNIYFLNSKYVILNQFKSNKFSHFLLLLSILFPILWSQSKLSYAFKYRIFTDLFCRQIDMAGVLVWEGEG